MTLTNFFAQMSIDDSFMDIDYHYGEMEIDLYYNSNDDMEIDEYFDICTPVSGIPPANTTAPFTFQAPPPTNTTQLTTFTFQAPPPANTTPPATFFTFQTPTPASSSIQATNLSFTPASSSVPATNFLFTPSPAPKAVPKAKWRTKERKTNMKLGKKDKD